MPKFSPEVANRIGNYVYRLIDPRNGETFYVGKGEGNRVFEHAKAALKSGQDQDGDSLKISRILNIMNSGLEVLHVIHRHNIPEHAVYDVEAAVIDAFAGLTNKQGGHGSFEFGPMSPTEIVDKYELPEIDHDPDEGLILININRIEDFSTPEAVYRQVQLAWRIDVRRAAKADHVLAVRQGIVVGAFEAHEWLDATHENFPNRIAKDEEFHNRSGFRGVPAKPKVWATYVGERGKRVANEKMRHTQNPVRYWRI